MRRRVRLTAWLLGIAVLGIAVEAEKTAQATGVKITGGGLKEFGEPYYFYELDFFLLPQYEFLPGDSVTLEMLAGVNDTSSYHAPGGSPSGPWAATITDEGTGNIPNYSPPYSVPFADITYFNAFNTVQNTNPTGGPQEYLGLFEVLTAVNMPVLPPSYFIDIDWTATLHTLGGAVETDTGVVVLNIITPEPASVILLGAGISLPIILLERQRRRRSTA